MMRKAVRRLLEPKVAVFVLAVIAFSNLVLKPAVPTLGDPTPNTILVVGDFSAVDSPARQIELGLSARLEELECSPATFNIKRVDESKVLRQNGPNLNTSIENLLIDAMASEPVVAVIVCSTSKSASPVLRIVAALNRPAIVTVASQDELLSQEFSSEAAVRLIASNTSEGEAIAEEISGNADKRVSIFTDGSPYAAQITDAIYRYLRKHGAQPTAGDLLSKVTFNTFGHLPSVADIQSAAKSSDWIVAIGYDELNWQVLRTLTSNTAKEGKYPGRLIFADSAIPNLEELSTLPNAYIVFPAFEQPSIGKETVNGTKHAPASTFYFDLGRDCLDLVRDAKLNVGWEPNMRTGFFHYWTSVRRRIQGQDLVFEPSGQLSRARWQILSVSPDSRQASSTAPPNLQPSVSMTEAKRP